MYEGICNFRLKLLFILETQSLLSLMVKENRSTFAEVMGKNQSGCFFSEHNVFRPTA